LILLSSVCAHSTKLAWDAKAFMGLDEIRPGMVGYGKTVFHGTKVETFNIKVISVMRKIDFDFDMILIEVTSGPVVERKLQTVQGMSGSPIYINDRLIGAYAYGWGFQKEAIAGVTPIANMLEDAQPGSAPGRVTGAVQPDTHNLRIGKRTINRIVVAANATEANRVNASGGPSTMVLTPLATPLLADGLPESQLKPMQSFLDQFNVHVVAGMTAGVAPVAAPKKPVMEAGSAIAVPVLSGDVNMSAVGTVTYVKGNTMLAFGHPFFLTGKANMPFSLAYIHCIINSTEASFKLGTPIAQMGALTGDYYHCIVGEFGKDPQMIPFECSYADASRHLKRTFRFRVVNDPFFGPYFGVGNALGSTATLASGRMMFQTGSFTGSYAVETDAYGTIAHSATMRAGGSMMSDLTQLFPILMYNPYEKVHIKKVTTNIAYTPGERIATIERVVPDRQVARPGEAVNFTVYVHPFQKALEIRKVSVTIPATASEGQMIILIAGGATGSGLRSAFAVQPFQEEGIRGIIRWVQADPDPASLVVARVVPAASINYRGRFLPDVPAPLVDQFRAGELTGAGSLLGVQTGNMETVDRGVDRTIRPTIYTQVISDPYILSGGLAVPITIDAPDRRAIPTIDSLVSAVPVTLLTTAATGAAPPATPAARLPIFAVAPWLTAAQRMLIAEISKYIVPGPPMADEAVILPSLAPRPAFAALPLSLLADAAPAAGDKGNEPVKETPKEPVKPETTPETPKPKPPIGDLLTKAPQSWTLAEGRDFAKGTQIGTTVSSHGALLLTPAVRALLKTDEMAPTKIVATANGVYLAGWKSNHLLRVSSKEEVSTVFPLTPAEDKSVETITALTADSVGNLLLATWPNNTVRLLSPAGNLVRAWTLPDGLTWDLAITSDGRRFAAESSGQLLNLSDDPKNDVQVVCTVPDKQLYCLAPGAKGDLFLATYPRGKVFRLTREGELSAVYEAKEMVASLAADATGNLFIGTSPACEVICVTPAGGRSKVQVGTGRGNQHVMSLALAGDDLYAATGPTGGIYRIQHPASADPDVIQIFARQDLRSGVEEQQVVGTESLMVNDLAVSAKGEVYAAASTPGQVLKLEPRAQGDFLSLVFPTPSVAKWGAVDIRYTLADKPGFSTALPAQLRVETRTGASTAPDLTWSKWAALRDGQRIASPAAGFAQLRLHLVSGDAAPAVEFVRAQYQPANQAPLVKFQGITAGLYYSGKKELRWDGKDPDGDELIYTLSYSKDGKEWTPIDLAAPAVDKDKPAADKEKTPATPTKPQYEISATTFTLDTKGIPDGLWRLRVTASDKYARPNDAASAEAITGQIIVDNTPPTANLADRVERWELAQAFTVSDNLTTIAGGKFRLDGGPWIAITAEDGLFDSTVERVKLVCPDGPPTLTSGDHKLEIMVQDAAGNQLVRTITVAIP